MKHIKVEAENGIEDVDKLFHRYLGICNKAIKKHKDEFPYQTALNLGKTIAGDRPIDLAIYDDEPKASFSLRLQNKELVEQGKPEDVKKAWRVNLSYLRKVVEHPDDYIEHPEKLDLDWLKSRLGF